MSTDIQHIDVDSDEWENTPKALRDQVKKLQKALTETQERSDGYRTQLTTRALGDVLAEQKFKNPSKVQKDLIADGIDPLNGDAVREWITSNADDYARGEGAASATASATESAIPDPHASLADEYNRLTLGGAADPASLEKHTAVFATLTPDMTTEQVEQRFREAGL